MEFVTSLSFLSFHWIALCDTIRNLNEYDRYHNNAKYGAIDSLNEMRFI